MWSSWPWVAMQPSMRSALSQQVGEVGQHQVDPEHVEVGEHQAAVDEHDAVVDLDAGAVPPDLAETAEERDPYRRCHERRG